MKRTIVVGGSRGIGQSVAALLGARGHDVTIIARTPPSTPVPRAEYWHVDLTDEHACSSTLEQIVRAHGAIHHLVFVQRYRGSGESWSGELEVALDATRRVIETLAGALTAEASIVIVSSINSTLITRELPLGYHVAKAAVNQMARYYAVALGGRHIRVNSVSPGTVLKDESRAFYQQNRVLQTVLDHVVPLGRMGTAEDIARVVAFLCSDDSCFVTGQNIVVDGGVSLEWQENVARRFAFEFGQKAKIDP